MPPATGIAPSSARASRHTLATVTTLAAATGAVLTPHAQGEITFLASSRVAEMLAVPEQPECGQSLSSTAPGLFFADYFSGCDSGTHRVRQNTFIVPDTFVGGTGSALHIPLISIASVRSTLECRFAVGCVATIQFGGLLTTAGEPEGRASVSIARERGSALEEIFVREAVSFGAGDVSVPVEDAVVLPAGTYRLSIDAYASAIDAPGLTLAFTTFDVQALFTVGNTLCPADLNADGMVDGADLGVLLRAWRSDNNGCDLSGDATTDGDDLEILLESWGACEARFDVT